MDLKQLQYFVVSVDNGSFKKAAEVLYTSQPHISKTIKALEEELQVELLERKARGVEATDAGRRLYEHACRILVEAGRIYEIQERQDDRVLRIAACPCDCLESLFARFCEEAFKGGLRACYTESNMEEILKMLHRHRAELGFLYVNQNQMSAFKQIAEHRHLEFTELARTGAQLYLGPASPLYHAPAVTNRELRELDYVQMKDDEDYLNINLIHGNEDYRYHKRRGQVLETGSRGLLMRLLRETCLCSIGCGLFSESSGEGDVRAIPIRGSEESILFGYVKRKRDALSSEAERFVKYVKEQLSQGGMRI